MTEITTIEHTAAYKKFLTLSAIPATGLKLALDRSGEQAEVIPTKEGYKVWGRLPGGMAYEYHTEPPPFGRRKPKASFILTDAAGRPQEEITHERGVTIHYRYVNGSKELVSMVEELDRRTETTYHPGMIVPAEGIKRYDMEKGVRSRRVIDTEKQDTIAHEEFRPDGSRICKFGETTSGTPGPLELFKENGKPYFIRGAMARVRAWFDTLGDMIGGKKPGELAMARLERAKQLLNLAPETP